MSTSPPYLRVGPVAIHIHSREGNREPTPPPTDYSFAEPTLDVEGSVLLFPDDDTSVEELNGVAPSNASPSTLVSPVPSLSPSPSPVGSTPYSSISSSVKNADYRSLAQSLAPIPSSATSAQGPNARRSSNPGPQASPTPTPTFLPETKGHPSGSTFKIASSPVPASSSSPAADSQPTVLASSTVAVLSDSSLVESIGPTSTSSPGPASPTVASENSTTNKNTTTIIVGSILAAILGVALILAVIAWFLRVRSRRKSEDELLWDPEPNTNHASDSDGFFDSPSLLQVGQDGITPPARPRPPGPNTISQPGFVGPQIVQAPYSRLATPELAHTTGPLTVTNLMPGDVPLSTNTSIFMGSRPGSTQVTPRIDNSTPRFTRLQDGGLPVPWSRSTPETSKEPGSRPKAWPSRLSAASLRNVFSSSPPKPAQVDARQPRTSAVNMRTHFSNSGANKIRFPEPARTTDQSWSGTIRTGITNALSAVMGTSARPQEPLDNNLTPIPPRPNRRLSSKTGISTLDSMSTTSTQLVGMDYTMVEKSNGRGVVHIHPLGRPHETLSFNEIIKEEETEHESEISSLALPDFSTSKEVPVSEWTQVPQIPRVPDDTIGRPSSLPRLPTIRPLSRGWTLRSEGFITLPESDDGYRSAFNQMINERKQEYSRRFVELGAVAAEEASRPIMSRASTTSLMTESTALSRESSVMDDEERKAKKVLRMRRERAMALSAVGAGSSKLSESGTGMRKPG